MPITTDPEDPRLKTTRIDGQQDAYLVLSEEERKKGFIRPLRMKYKHVGIRPVHPTRELTAEEKERYKDVGYVLFEQYPKTDASSVEGRFWTQAQLDSGCDEITTMGLPIAETYARNPGFYGSTFCTKCKKHLRVGEHGEFVWVPDGSRVGT